MAMYLIFLLTLCSLYGNGIVPIQATESVYRNLQSLSSDSANKLYRTAYHFQPPCSWMNDPNGPMRYRGLYHLFYQQKLWDKVFWGHSVSEDLVNWTPLDPAIYPSQDFDGDGCWSGSATMLHGGKPAILYTGQPNQVQNLAYPKNLSDPFLREWVKSPENPIIVPPRNDDNFNIDSFRDPSSAWLGKDGQWRVIIGSIRTNGSRGMAVMYRSKDFLNWTLAQDPLFSAQGTGMWECPDYFPVLKKGPFGVDTSTNDGEDIRHVLKVSSSDKLHDYYLIGTYNTTKDVFIPDRGFDDIESVLRFDYGKYYASKTFFDDGMKRRILFAWVNESSSLAFDIKKGWAGIQAIPRSIWLHESGKQLVQWPVQEIEKLRVSQVNWPTKVLKGDEQLQVTGVTAAQADVEISFEVNGFEKAEVLDYWPEPPQIVCSKKGAGVKGGLGPFGLLVLASKDLQEYTAVFFRIVRYEQQYLVLMCSDQSSSSLNKENDLTTYGTFVDLDPLKEKLSLRILIDHSVVESFGGEGRACITARVYPTLAINDKAQLYAFNYGNADVNITRLSAWSMKKPRIN